MSNKALKTQIALKLIKLMQDTELPAWRCPWIFTNLDRGWGSTSCYRGVNAIMTSLSRVLYGYNSKLWFTFSKVQKLNGKSWNDKEKKWYTLKDINEPPIKIRQGANALPICYWNWTEVKDRNGNVSLDKTGKPVKVPFLKSYKVFNGDDIENFDTTPFEKLSTDVSVVDCQKVLDSLLSSYKNHPEVAYADLDEALYRVDSDKILIPNPNQFVSVSEFASTIAHELAHSTGHMSRLNRFTSSSNDKNYAKEELVAEFTSAMVLAHLGIEEMPTLENSAAYLKSWLSFLSDKPDILFDIIASAMKACSMIIGESDSNPFEENDSVKTD